MRQSASRRVRPQCSTRTLRLPDEVKEALRETAAREGRSEHDVIVAAVQRYTADRTGRRDALIDTVLERDVGLLAGAASRPATTWNGVDVCSTLDEKAAALLLSLVTDHALVDGNQRLGWVAVNGLHGLNGSRLRASEDDAYDGVMTVATDVPDVAAILGAWREVPGS